ncbi:Glycosyltransferase, GT2 family [Halopseudomonas xinjiangensis]|uniref:Glycosyltransferase, GT2 family n=1 Tax=Halopseudomonas xinjiangensis TaxID=487184 RepID=A0A1H1NNI4_9GAMM|nr:glycosyltransferase [Halopseudomonas xinjiangensis]SDS00487.1 Glycosyltransferase, GT2 family [Halopseudomonas xinjiangensis]
MKALPELYEQHKGKVSDKWSLYLKEYDELLSPYRDRSVNLLEIGIQNGGSLEIWSQYFPKAIRLVGCDINPNCAQLEYEDARIAVVVGDANSDESESAILSHAKKFDIIIDDGSHTSGDIVRSFARYFPYLKPGGILLAEDLHCSYWQGYQGGLYNPFSSITFFKRLGDVVNFEHWGRPGSRSTVLAGFAEHYGVTFSEEALAAVHSVQFVNSLCVVKKAPAPENVLGERLIVGETEPVLPLRETLSASPASTPDQSENPWTMLDRAPDEQFDTLKQQLAQREAQRADLSNRLAEESQRVSALDELVQHDAQQMQSLGEQHSADLRRIEELKGQILQHQQRAEEMERIVAQVWSSTSWKATSPLRIVGTQAKHLRTLGGGASHLFKHYGAIGSVRKVLEVMRTEGVAGFRHRVEQQVELQAENDYAEWVRLYDSLKDEDRKQIRRIVAEWVDPPLISIVVPTYNPSAAWFTEAVDSVRNQLYPNWELCIADDASTDPAVRPLLEKIAASDSRIKVVFREQNGHISAASNSALSLATGQWVALLDHDDLLPEHALYCVAKAIIEDPSVRMIYSDEDKMNEKGQRYSPYFKCDWNPDLFYSHNMFSHLGVYQKQLLDEIGGFRLGVEGSQDYDLALRCIERIDARAIHHIPRVLYHWRVHAESTASGADAKPYAMLAGMRAINEHFERTGVKGKVELVGPGYHASYDLEPTPPLVSLIIPTRNGVELLRQCVSSIREKTDYPNYELIIIDNGSDDPATLSYLRYIESPTVRVIRDDRPFNFSALNNVGAAAASGEVLGLINNDIEVISPSWLREMVSHALRPEVGAVGAKLSYPNDRIQHAGVVLGMGGVAEHAHKQLPRTAYGYFSRASLISGFSAVTGACLIVRKALYQELGGLNEELAVAYNDIDFCLRLKQAGYRNIFLPSAELYHHESATRGPESDPAKLERLAREEQYMWERWEAWLKHDPAYSPNLTLERQDFTLAWPPRVRALF